MTKKDIKIIQTAKDTEDRLSEKEDLQFTTEYNNNLPTLEINQEEEYQEITGFGGAFTEAGGYTLSQIPEEKRQEVIEAYFHPEKGIGYTLCRTHINSCDFSLGNYAYTETEGDTELEDFDISRDKEYLIPFINDALNVEEAEFKLFASPWSPPAWMKTNERMNQGGSLKEEYWQTWANYFAKYIKEYREEGIDMWGVTIQNEPMAETPWDNCIYQDEEERDFVKVLGPTLKEAGLEDIKIMVWDHNKDIMKSRVDTILSDEEAAQWVWGVGFHWYGSSDSKSIEDDKVLSYTYQTYDKELVFTEGCNPLYDEDNFFGEWWTGEKYGRHIISNLNHYTTGWVDWNMVLNEEGGPNHVENYCDAPIIVDTENNEIIYESPYYYLGHFSKYIRPGAKRIACNSDTNQLRVTAAKNPDGKIAVIVMNESDEEISFNLKNNDGQATRVVSPAHSIQTLIY
ncbi:O-glycosyl hydrolase [Halobacteroides halobius DSM 5150]|uniref:O-glycosyl hydrolase n=1 Tax=Halobacteroides halobius (strain ATCC 35273 / DSM 5150 / MD-1) TaxID=748449 RepID=L0K4U8_HALHC|nr:glycoside hydrolase family 30 protein [Halobacteroides halobius]AGB40277.1 O-glycosyl hydrolase [Halobacteroides halobius DSM 5150]